MSTEAAMKFVGEIDGRQVYWAEPGRFTTPGIHYWDGTKNVHVPIAATPATDQPGGEAGEPSLVDHLRQLDAAFPDRTNLIVSKHNIRRIIAALAQPDPAGGVRDEVLSAHVIISPVCRVNRGDKGAIDEAVRRITDALKSYIDSPHNKAVSWHIKLIRKDPVPAVMLERPSDEWYRARILGNLDADDAMAGPSAAPQDGGA